MELIIDNFLTKLAKDHQLGLKKPGLVALEYFVLNHLKKYPNKKLLDYVIEGIGNDVLNKFVFKKIKAKALFALDEWANDRWEFLLVNKILTPYQVLELGTQGIRPVTMIFQKEFKPILHKDDCLEFFVHDLEHGYMFYHDQSLKNSQVKFFNKIHESLSENIWEQYLMDDNFKEKFYYLISDMNTHTEHYRHYLKAILPLGDFGKFENLFKE